VVVTSTSEVYGTAKVVPIMEGHSLNPQSPYAASKVAGDAIAGSFFETYGLPVTILRPFNTFGPRQSERAIVPTIIRQAIDPRCPVVKLGSIDARRDLTFVGDTVNAFLEVGSYDNPVCVGETYNCGAGKSLTIGELAQYLSNGKEIALDEERTRNNEVWHLEAGTTKIRQDTGWEPEVSLTDGLAVTRDWWSYRLAEMKDEARYVV
jgi:UDP-glucose 4-epimerase